jgi:serine/threonine protein phosphatase PrpC
VAKLLRLDVAQLTDVGRKREHNEDNMAYVIPKDTMAMIQKGALFIVADGMGGHAAGEVASEIAVDTVSNTYYQDDHDDVPAALLYAIRRANTAIHQRAAENMLRNGMGTTCVAAVLRGNVAYIANVGDSRAYLIRKSRIKQVSQDHSWVAEQVRAGLLTEEQARTHAQRNVITRSLGTQPDVEIDIFREVLEEGDTLVLCSDGLSGLVSDEDLMHTVEQFVPQESVYHLVEHANESGGPDNITAIVARVQELGVEPPGVRQPVPIGGPEVSNEDTARLFAPLGTVGMNMPTRNGELPVPGSPFPYTSGPLAPADSVTAPQPAPRVKTHRGRLFYPTVVLAILFLLTAIGSGTYYFIHTTQAQTITQTLDAADQLLSQAGGNLTSNPTLALQNLASAQQQLQSLKNDSLDTNATSRLASLQTQLVSDTKNAITNYNTAAKIVLVPCTGTTPSSVNNGTTGAQAQAVALLQDSNKVLLYYALGQDGKIYQLNPSSSQYSMASPFPTTGNTQIISFVGSNVPNASGKLFALSEQSTNNTPPGYAVDLLVPGPQGMLSVAKSQNINLSSPTQNGNVPTLIAAWENNVYVVLSSKANPNTITILSYSVGSNNTFSTLKQTSPSVSAGVIGITAFSDKLFLLLSDGEVLSSQIHSDLTLSTPLTSVLISAPIPVPLSTSAEGFTANTSVPTTTPTTQKGSGSLMVPMASTSNLATISAGLVQADNQIHLFIGDPANHRVLNLVAPTASSGGPGMTPTVTGGISGNPVTLDFVQQYASLSSFKEIKSVATDPAGTNLNILDQSAPDSESLVTVSTSTQQTCAS